MDTTYVPQVKPLPKQVRNVDPVSIQRYMERHPYCQVCGVLCYHHKPHHLKTRGSGGGDEPENLIRLCPLHHRMAHDGNISKDELRHAKEA